MLSESVKKNINKIDYELKELFSDVKITEKNFHNKYFFEIIAEGLFHNLLESNTTRKVKSLVIIEKKDLEGDIVTWKYSINPNNTKADFIERTSRIEKISEDIHNTVVRKQMDINYLNNTPEIEVEEQEEEVEEKDSFELEVEKTMERYQVEVKDLTSSVNPFSGNLYDKPTKTLLVHHNGIDITKMFKLEAQLLKLEKVNYIFFDKEFVKINHN